MNPAHIHLLFNHFPLIGTLFGILVLVAGFLIKNEWVKNTAYGIFILTALLSVPALMSGEGAEEAIENLPGIEESYIEKHEELAGVAIWLVASLGIFAIATLVLSLQNKPFSKQFSLLTLLVAFITFGMMARVNNSGGEIRHPEIRKGATAAPQNQEGKENDD